MESDLTQERQQGHALLDMLSAEKLTAVRGLLEVMVEPLSRSLAMAPVEDGIDVHVLLDAVSAIREMRRTGPQPVVVDAPSEPSE
jgi:hypothetical protein